jgi:hypothetical protein
MTYKATFPNLSQLDYSPNRTERQVYTHSPSLFLCLLYGIKTSNLLYYVRGDD